MPRGMPMAPPVRKRKLTGPQFAARFDAEKALQKRRYCNAFALWRKCALKHCRREATCCGNQHACLKRALSAVPHPTQWQARQDILLATPFNIGAPERAARKCMPLDFYAQTTAMAVADYLAFR
jgi:hypothetical protein